MAPLVSLPIVVAWSRQRNRYRVKMSRRLTKPSRLEEARRVIEEYAADLREIIKKLRRRLKEAASVGGLFHFPFTFLTTTRFNSRAFVLTDPTWRPSNFAILSALTFLLANILN